LKSQRQAVNTFNKVITGDSLELGVALKFCIWLKVDIIAIVFDLQVLKFGQSALKVAENAVKVCFVIVVRCANP
jgi:hypothetical protein